jgi:hypothetical protein
VAGINEATTDKAVVCHGEEEQNGNQDGQVMGLLDFSY